MKIILETERLILREFIPSDGYHFFHLNNDSDVIKYTGNAPFKNLEEANSFIKNYNEYEKRGYGRWAVCLKKTNEFLGWCGLKYEEEYDQIDLGYRFYKKHWGLGYATESADACVNYGFNQLNIEKIVGRALIKNKDSIKVLQKCNFTFETAFIYEKKQAVLYIIKNDNS